MEASKVIEQKYINRIIADINELRRIRIFGSCGSYPKKIQKSGIIQSQ